MELAESALLRCGGATLAQLRALKRSGEAIQRAPGHADLVVLEAVPAAAREFGLGPLLMPPGPGRPPRASPP